MSSENKKGYFGYEIGGCELIITPDDIKHNINREHNFSVEEWNDFLQSMHSIADVSVTDGINRPKGVPINTLSKGILNTYGAVFEFAANNRIYLKTAVKSTKSNIKDWMKKRGAAVQWHYLTDPLKAATLRLNSQPLSVSSIHQVLEENNAFDKLRQSNFNQSSKEHEVNTIAMVFLWE